MIKQIDYDAFGNVISDSNPEFKVAGGLQDNDTGLIRFGYRDYDPETGRWTARDPIGFAGGDTNLYGYVLGDPVNAIDIFGLFDVKVGPKLGGDPTIVQTPSMGPLSFDPPGPNEFTAFSEIPGKVEINSDGVTYENDDIKLELLLGEEDVQVTFSCGF